jgi:hypothetical protein
MPELAATRPSMNDGPDLFGGGWRWCAKNRRWLQATVPPERETTCAGCGSPCPPPIPNPYEREVTTNVRP